MAVAVTSDVHGGAEKCLIDVYGHARLREEFTGVLVGRMAGWGGTGLPGLSMGPARKWGRGAMPRELARLPLSIARGSRAIAATGPGGPSLVHLSFKREQILLTRRAARVAPVLWTEHGALPRGRRWRALAPHYRAAARAVTAIICVADHVADDVAWALGRWCPPIHVIENSVEVSAGPPPGEHARRGARARLGLPATGLVLASTARLSPTKRVGLVLDAAARLPGATALVCGDGPERDALERRAAPGSAVFTGFLDDPTDAYLAADVLVHATDGAGEGLPFTLLESAAHAVPAVVCADSGLGGVVRGWGAVAARADGGDIADAALTLGGGEPRRAAHAWAERHSLEAAIDGHLAVMRAVARNDEGPASAGPS